MTNNIEGRDMKEKDKHENGKEYYTDLMRGWISETTRRYQTIVKGEKRLDTESSPYSKYKYYYEPTEKETKVQETKEEKMNEKTIRNIIISFLAAVLTIKFMR